jgi:hypothetical protein
MEFIRISYSDGTMWEFLLKDDRCVEFSEDLNAWLEDNDEELWEAKMVDNPLLTHSCYDCKHEELGSSQAREM